MSDDMVTIHSSIVPVSDVLDAFNSPAPPSASGDPEDLLTPKETAAWLRTEVETLATWRTQNRGPAFVKVGASIRYRRQSIFDFVRANEFANTTQADGNRR